MGRRAGVVADGDATVEAGHKVGVDQGVAWDGALGDALTEIEPGERQILDRTRQQSGYALLTHLSGLRRRAVRRSSRR